MLCRAFCSDQWNVCDELFTRGLWTLLYFGSYHEQCKPVAPLPFFPCRLAHSMLWRKFCSLSLPHSSNLIFPLASYPSSSQNVSAMFSLTSPSLLANLS